MITKKLVATDIDGTLLTPDRKFADLDIETLHLLGEKGIYRVVATGRNLYSCNEIFSDNFPIDYLIFSNGAGIMNWMTREIIYSRSLQKEKVAYISDHLIKSKIDFFIHFPIPDSHLCYYFKNGDNNPDFNRRMLRYKDFAVPLNLKTHRYKEACQVLAIIPDDVELLHDLMEKAGDIKVIRSTSPLDDTSIWVEFFNLAVSKGNALKWLCNRIHVDRIDTISVGNDYNDLDLLHFTAQSFVVANSPDSLKQLFTICKSNSQCGFTDAVKRAMILE